MTAPAPGARRRFVVGSVVGGVLAFALFAVFLTVTNGHPDLLRRDTFGSFFDAQARSFLHGRWDVPAKDAAIEGFVLHGRTYIYFGIFPAVLRMPILAVAPSLYGRLTQLSMLLAAALIVVSVALLHWRIRGLVRPGRPCGRLEPAAVTFVAVCGTALMFLASRPIVYHEAIAWGVAWALLAYDRILAFVERPGPLTLGVAALCATCAFMSRASVGLGPVVALGLFAAGQILGVVRPHVPGRARTLVGRLDWLGADGERPRRPVRWAAACVVAAAVPVAAYVAVNYARFGSPTAIPWSKQVVYQLSAQNRRVLAQNHGTYFGTKFAPTTLLQYTRPDALRPDAVFPWLTFPPYRAQIVGNIQLIESAVSTSMPASVPALTILGAIGVAAIWWPRLARERALARLRAPLIGSAVAVVPVITVAYVGNRYLSDFVPLLLIAALAGLVTIARRRDDAPGRRWPRVLVVAVALLAVFGVWANVALAFVNQRLYNPQRPADRVGMLALQYRIDRVFGGRPRDVTFRSAVPRRIDPGGTIAVVGRCDALYWSDGVWWWPVEGRPSGGRFRLHVTFPSAMDAQWEPLVAIGAPGDQLVVAARGAGRRVELGIGHAGTDGTLAVTPAVRTVAPPAGGRPDVVDVLADAWLQHVTVSVDGDSVLVANARVSARPQPYEIGRASTPGVAARFDGTARLERADVHVCESILARRHA